MNLIPGLKVRLPVYLGGGEAIVFLTTSAIQQIWVEAGKPTPESPAYMMGQAMVGVIVGDRHPLMVPAADLGDPSGKPPIPRVGPPIEDFTGTCTFATGPSEPACGQPATWHVIAAHPGPGDSIIVTAEGDLIALPACDRHLHFAREAGQMVSEHRFTGFCGFPASIWNPHLNACELDVSAVEPRRPGAET